MRTAIILAAAVTLFSGAAYASSTPESDDCKPKTLFELIGVDQTDCSVSDTSKPDGIDDPSNDRVSLLDTEDDHSKDHEMEPSDDHSNDHADDTEESDGNHESDDSHDDHESDHGSEDDD